MDKIQEMKTILASVKKKEECVLFRNYSVQLLSKYHLLHHISANSEWKLPCLLVHKLPQRGSERTKNESTIMDDPDDLDDSPQRPVNTDESFGGSPLKMQHFEMDSFVGEDPCDELTPIPIKRLKALSAQSARFISSLYNLCISSEKSTEQICFNQPPPLWVLCDANDKEHTALLGSHSWIKQGRHYFSTTKVQVHGSIYNDIFLTRHNFLKEFSSAVNAKYARTPGFAKYTVSALEQKDCIVDSAIQERSLEVHFTWNQVMSPLHSPSAEAKATVNVTVAAGNPESAAHLLYIELSILQNLVQGIASGQAQWSSQSEKLLLVKVKRLVKDVQGGAGYLEAKKTEAHDDSVFLHASQRFVQEREELDFTELLWNILKDCCSLESLLECLNYVLESLKSGEIQPVVHPDNHSTLANLVRDSYYSKMEPPALEQTRPLELLAEIGLEKIQNDYSHAFLTKELVTMENLEKFIHFKGSLTERFDGLQKLHYTLELIAMLETLKLPMVMLSISARKALKHYESKPVEDGHTFEITVQTSLVKSLCERVPPSVWQQNFITERNGEELQSLYMFTTKPPIQHLHLDKHEATDHTEEAVPFYLTRISQDLVVL